MTQFGPLAGGLFLSGGALLANAVSKSDYAKAAADVFTEMVGGTAADLLHRATSAIRDGRNGDLEKSMHRATGDALEILRKEASSDDQQWFTDWLHYLNTTSPHEVFTGRGDSDPLALQDAVQYDDDEFRALWWSQMEPSLLRWRQSVNSQFLQLHLSGPQTLPESLRTLLRNRLPETLQSAHDIVLRDEKFKASWIAFQQHTYRETFDKLNAIQSQLNRIEAKLDGQFAKGMPGHDHIWTIPRPTQHFQDRPDLITQIDRALALRSKTALTALHGLGGIGKSQMARHFAHLRRADYKLGVWLESETSVSLLASLSALAPLLGVTPEPDQQATVARVLQALCARQPWLVIFDNAESSASIRPIVESLNGEGHVLITSRNSGNDEWSGLAQPVSITRWEPEESIRFLLHRTGQSDRASAEALAKDLDGLALALEHAAAFMRLGDGTPLAEYRKLWRDKLAHSPGAHEDYHQSVAASLGLSLDRLQSESPLAYELLSVFAWLAPDRIPKKELLEAAAAKLPPALAEAHADANRWAEVIEALGRYSLLRRERVDGVATGYYLHRVVQQVMQDRLDAETKRATFATACDFLCEAFPFDSYELKYWPVCDLLIPHARVLREHSWNLQAPESFMSMLNQAGLYLSSRALYAEARDFGELALESALGQLGPDHPIVAGSRSNLSTFLHDLGEHGEARTQIELALESALRQFGPDHPTVAVRRSNLASVLHDLGEHGEARKQIELALESALRQFGPDHPNVAVHRSNLAIVLHAFGEYGEARKQIKLALESALRQFGPDHPNVATRRSNLASVLQALGEYREARKQIELALESALLQFGPDHSLVATRRINLAHILNALKQPCEALREIDEALCIRRKNFPGGHPYIDAAESTRAVLAAACAASGKAK